MTTAIATHDIRALVQQFRFKELFNELGWNRYRAPLSVAVDGQIFTLAPVAEKANLVVYQCPPLPGGGLPDHALRRKIEREVEKPFHEHFLIYTDVPQTQQVWQWVRRASGKTTASREKTVYRGQAGEALAQKLHALAISLEDEAAGLTVVDVSGRVRAAFDVEPVTRKFYDLFKKEHDSFLGFLQGIPDEGLQSWYVSVLLNRLMFVYFIQSKRLLNDDPDYLQHKLQEIQRRGQDRFYRRFLCTLFFQGLAQRPEERTPEVHELLGEIPYLNGGLFTEHQIEQLHGQTIQIADKAFEQVFAFFNEFDWHLDNRPLRNDKEINPDVLGYIFEKYINQKQMGAYYTKEDITGYISQNTIIPFIFDATEQKDLMAFRPDGSIWSLLREDPDKYIYDAVKKGCATPLPPEIEAGVHDVTQRGAWNKAAPEEYALPTEIWREVVARRTRYEEVRAKLAAGEVHSINDLITYNLDISKFAVDVITYCEGSNLLLAFYHAIESVTVLDPTCGSGAFLFAALNILEPLYEACLDHMQNQVEERDQLNASIPPAQRRRYPAIEQFRAILSEVEQHPSRIYFIYKSIIINNLYGVDIMEEATEICKLRLFLKLVSQVEKFDDIEPLPDIDFNIRAGNTLVGFASQEETTRALQGKTVGKGIVRESSAYQNQMIFDDRMNRIEQKAQEIERAFKDFRKIQTEFGQNAEDMAANKQSIRKMLKELGAELDGYLASEYGIDRNNITQKDVYDGKFKHWQESHQPFHWWIEFYGIMKAGGFDVIIGNPPYVEYRLVRNDYKILAGQYKSESTSNLYAFCMERSTRLISPISHFGMIVPAGLLGLDEALPLREVLTQHFRCNWFSTFAIRPSKLFDGVDQRLCIHIASNPSNSEKHIYTTIYHHWYSEERSNLLKLMRYYASEIYPGLNRIPQVGNAEAAGVMTKLRAQRANCIINFYASDRSGFLMHYHRSPRYWIRGMDFEQYFKSQTRDRSIHHFRNLYFNHETQGKNIGAILNSTLFFFWFISVGNGRNITGTDVEQFPVGELSQPTSNELTSLFTNLMDDYKVHSLIRVRQDCEFQEFRPSMSKPIIDEIDRVLAKHYGFTDEELDFIINYDIKYRMGRDSGDEGEE